MNELELVSFLESVGICRGLNRLQLQGLTRLLKPQLLPAKSVMFREGDPGDSFYFIRTGEVGVYKRIPGASQERLAVLGAGTPVGHLCLIDGEPRSASCVALSRTLVLRGEKVLFDRLFNQGDALAFRFIDNLSRELCENLRQLNQRLFDLYARPDETTARLHQVARQINSAMDEECAQATFQPQENREQGGLRRSLSAFLR